jgi:beta-glucosidase
MGVGFVRGVQDHILANPKHFAANSIENTRFAVDVSVDERTLREVYLPHFRAAVQEGTAARHVGVQQGERAVLRRERPSPARRPEGRLGLPGVRRVGLGVRTRSTVPAITAGLDIEMPFGHYYGDLLAQAVAAATSTRRRSMPRCGASCARSSASGSTPTRRCRPTQVGTPAHRDLARDVERESIVLLKNAGTALPLDRAALGSLVVVGDLAARPNLGDLGSSTVIPTSAAVVRWTASARRGRRPGDARDVHAAQPRGPGRGRGGDAAIVVAGLTPTTRARTRSRSATGLSLVLPRDQDALIAAVAALNPRTIVVLEGSGAVLMPWLDDVAAVVEAWYPGQEGGTRDRRGALRRREPVGKLPVSFPRAEADLPPFDNVSFAVTYGYFHGYRWLDRNGVAPLFPFGFGLSYTSFAYANLRVAPATLVPWGASA